MRSAGLLLLLAATTLLTAACGGIVDNLTGSKLSGTSDNLWPDVPPLVGAQRVDMDMPLPF
jgi:hypothetical protein